MLRRIKQMWQRDSPWDGSKIETDGWSSISQQPAISIVWRMRIWRRERRVGDVQEWWVAKAVRNRKIRAAEGRRMPTHTNIYGQAYSFSFKHSFDARLSKMKKKNSCACHNFQFACLFSLPANLLEGDSVRECIGLNTTSYWWQQFMNDSIIFYYY